ncbi:MAG: hypothetical protein IJ318_02845 [Clostridia bacterium]|nr:hypothetical protein [Clostridia bacterium]
MNKKAKIATIILFVILLAVQVYNVVMFAESVKLMNTESTDALALIAILPMFIIGIAVALVLAIIMLVVCKKTQKQAKLNEQPAPKLIKILTVVAWVLVVADVVLFALLYIL